MTAHSEIRKRQNIRTAPDRPIIIYPYGRYHGHETARDGEGGAGISENESGTKYHETKMALGSSDETSGRSARMHTHKSCVEDRPCISRQWGQTRASPLPGWSSRA